MAGLRDHFPFEHSIVSAVLNICYEKVSGVSAPLTSVGKLFHIRQPKYHTLCLKHSFFGRGGTLHPEDANLELIDISLSFLSSKFENILQPTEGRNRC